MQIPNLLKTGDTIAITAASGICTNTKLINGIRTLENMGLKVQVMDSCHATHGQYLAGEDKLRINDLHTAFADKNVKGIFMARGGYGAARLLPSLNYNLIRQNPKVFVGYSDVTALHIFLSQFCKLATFHGPMPVSCFGGEETHPLTLASFKAAVVTNEASRISQCLQKQSLLFGGEQTHANLMALHLGHASGLLTGGNLSVIASTLGTPYEIKTRGRILFLEDIQEEPYRVDRLLLQLKLAGKLKDAAGIVFGDFSPETLETLYIAIQELVLTEKKPTIWGFPSGHTSPNLTLPLGQEVTLAADPANPQLFLSRCLSCQRTN